MTRRTVAALSAALLLLGCGRPPERSPGPAAGDPFPVAVEGKNGTIEVLQRPRRIVSLSATATETLFAIGAGSQVVAVDQASDYPEGAPRTALSGFDPNVEAIAVHEPDLVVYSTEPGELEGALQATGAAALLQPPAPDLAEAYDQMLQLGAATGHRSEAEGLVAKLRGRISEIVESAPALDPAPAYYHELDVTGFTATSDTFIGELYRILRLRNIADGARPGAGASSGYVQLSSEYIIDANPDLIFLANAKCCGQSRDTLAQRPGWSRIDAVAKGRTFPLDDDIASRWGPRTAELLSSIAGALESLAAPATTQP